MAGFGIVGVERLAAADAWVESGLVFTEPDGSPLHPADVTEEFQRLAAEAGLPPIRLHDLRHGAATLALAAGVDMKVVQHMLRHASETTTSTFYTSVLPEVARSAADKVELIIPRASVRRLGRGSGAVETTMDSQNDQRESAETTKPQVNTDVDLRSGGTPPGQRSARPGVAAGRRHGDGTGSNPRRGTGPARDDEGAMRVKTPFGRPAYLVCRREGHTRLRQMLTPEFMVRRMPRFTEIVPVALDDLEWAGTRPSWYA